MSSDAPRPQGPSAPGTRLFVAPQTVEIQNGMAKFRATHPDGLLGVYDVYIPVPVLTMLMGHMLIGEAKKSLQRPPAPKPRIVTD